MKFYFFFFLTVVKCFGQDVSEINKELKLSDTLIFEKEIRIYKDYSITDKIEIFRMYDEGKNNWTVFKYYYSKNLKQTTKIEELKFPKEKVGKLKPIDANLIWLNLLLSNVEFLPSMESINYKLATSNLDLDMGEQAIVKKKMFVVDGESYQVYVKNGKIKNSFSFNNPEMYLKHYPTVDELISYNQLLSVIKKEFNLWKE